MGWFNFWKRNPKPAEPKSAPEAGASNTGPYTAADFPFSDPAPGAPRTGRSGVHGRPFDPEATDDEVGIAVVMPRHTSTEQELATIGLALREWQAANGFVRRIIGLAQLLAGTFPETPAFWFGLSIPPATERVALVFVAPEANTEETGASLNRALEGLSVAMVVSPGFYSEINR